MNGRGNHHNLGIPMGSITSQRSTTNANVAINTGNAVAIGPDRYPPRCHVIHAKFPTANPAIN
jgi:hypothetical protein